MAIPSGLNSFLQAILVLVISVFFLRLVLWRRRCRNLPPGPPAWPIVGNLLQIGFSSGAFQSSVKKFHERYGPIFTVWLGSRPMLMIATRELAHEALIQKGSIFADRPLARGMRKLFTSNQHSINSAAYGPLWRSLRRNLVSEALSPSAMKAFGEVREWGIGHLVENLRNEAARNGGVVSVVEQIRTAVFCILLWMCFGSKPNEETVISVHGVMREVILTGGGLDESSAVLGFFYRRRRARMVEIRRRQREALLTLINRRRDAPPSAGGAYIDTLFNLTVDGNRSLHDDELVTLCSEFISAGTDTTSTSLQWLMANLVIRQDTQARLYEEIVGVTGRAKPVEEDDLQRMPYLEAVVKETLRRHPPGHFLLPHAVTLPCELAGYKVPADASVNFYVAGIGMDPGVWQNPSEFKPERFADEGVEVDLTGTKEIKMMPFGAGRRVCAGLGLAMLHLNLIVARLVQEFAWDCKPGETVDLSETQESSMVMKYPLQAVIKERESGHK
jgi:hypothetical protein